MQRPAKQSDKLKMIVEFMNGSLEAFRKPKTYNVTKRDGLYTVDDQVMNEEQYKIFSSALRANDLIFFCDLTDCNEELKRIIPESNAFVWKEHLTFKGENETSYTRVQNAKPIKPKRKLRFKKKEREVQQIVVNKEPASSGLLSEYGETWGLTDKSIYMNLKGTGALPAGT